MLWEGCSGSSCNGWKGPHATVAKNVSDYVLTPKLLGENVGLHPVWVIFSFFAFGLVFGFLGLLIAIPAAAAIGVLIRHGVELYLESPIYLGRGGKAKK